MARLSLDRRLRQSPEVVWRTMTRPEVAADWLGARSFSATPGSRFEVRLPPGMGSSRRARCRVLHSEPPTRLELEWVDGGLHTRVELLLEADGSGTRLRLVHTGLPGRRHSVAPLLLGLAWRHRLGRLSRATGSAGLASTWLVVGVGAVSAVVAGAVLVSRSEPQAPAPAPPVLETAQETPATQPVRTVGRRLEPPPLPLLPEDTGTTAEAEPDLPEGIDIPEEWLVRDEDLGRWTGPLPTRERRLGRLRHTTPAVPEAQPAGELRVAVLHLPRTLSPMLATDAQDLALIDLVVDRLYLPDLSSHLVSREEVEDDRVRVWLDHQIRWHNGLPLTPEDVCATVQALRRHPDSPGGRRWAPPLLGCRVVERGRAAELRIDHSGDPREVLDFPVLPALGTRAWFTPGYDVSARPKGRGPMEAGRGRWAVRASWSGAEHRQPLLDVVEITELNDPRIALARLQSGELDGIMELPPGTVLDEEEESGLQLLQGPGAWVWSVALTNESPVLRDALVHALQPSELLEPGCPDWFPDDPRLWCGAASADEDALVAAMEEGGAEQRAGRWLLDDQTVSLRVATVGHARPLDLLEPLVNRLSAEGFEVEAVRLSSDRWQPPGVTSLSDPPDLVVQVWPAHSATHLLAQLDDAPPFTQLVLGTSERKSAWSPVVHGVQPDWRGFEEWWVEQDPQ